MRLPIWGIHGNRAFCPATLGISLTTEMMMATTMAATTASTIAAQQQASRQGAMVQAQAQLQQNQESQAAGQQDTVAAQAARAARGQSIVAAGAAGINTDSNSFVASLQTSTMNQYTDEQLINLNEMNASQATAIQGQSLMNSEASAPSVFGAIGQTTLAGAGGYIEGSIYEKMGAGTLGVAASKAAASGTSVNDAIGALEGQEGLGQ